MGRKGFFLAFGFLLIVFFLICGTIGFFLFHPQVEEQNIPPVPTVVVEPNLVYHDTMTLAEESAIYDPLYVHKYDSGYNRVYGIDISSWNNVNGGEIDWDRVHESGVEYVFIRAALRGYGDEGNLVVDKCFHQNVKAAKESGLLVGCYVYSQAVTQDEAREEAEFLLDLVQDYDIEMPLVMDCEFAMEAEGGGRLFNAGLSPELYALVCSAFCREIRNAGYTPMVYGNVAMLNESIYQDILGPTHLWVAQYNDICNLISLDYTFWQFTSSGSVPGINGDVDVNVWYLPDDVSLRPQDAAEWLGTGAAIS